MRKTVFPSALFGLCSTALLVMGLSSLRDSREVLARANLNETSSLSQAVTGKMGPLSTGHSHSWTRYEDALSFDLQTSENSTSDEVTDGSGDARPTATYQYHYYYRFIPRDDLFGEAPATLPATGATSAETAEIAKSMVETEGLESSNSAGYAFNFLDEYSAEEAARYEMAQESLQPESLPDETQVVLESYEPRYQKFYYLMSPREEVGRPGSGCQAETLTLTAKTASAEAVAHAPCPGQARPTHDLADEWRWTPDYEADVAAAWLFAASRQDLLAPEDSSLLSMVDATDATGAANEGSPEDPRVEEAYEDWQVYEDLNAGLMDAEEAGHNNDNLPEGRTDQEPGQNRDTAGQEAFFAPMPDEMGWTAKGFSQGPALDSSSNREAPELLTPGDWDGANPAEHDLHDGEDNPATWSIVNPDPIVGQPEEADSLSDTPLWDTPWHGEPGEGFRWDDASPSSRDTGVHTEIYLKGATLAESGLDMGAAWDLDRRGYRLSQPVISEQGLADSPACPAESSASGAGHPSPLAGESSSEEILAGLRGDSAAETDPAGDASHIYEGAYDRGQYRWEDSPELAQAPPQDMEIQAPVLDDLNPAASEAENLEDGVDLGRLLRGLAEAVRKSLPSRWSVPLSIPQL